MQEVRAKPWQVRPRSHPRMLGKGWHCWGCSGSRGGGTGAWAGQEGGLPRGLHLRPPLLGQGNRSDGDREEAGKQTDWETLEAEGSACCVGHAGQ